MSPTLFALVIFFFLDRVSHFFTFTSHIARIIGVYHSTWLIG
jgi:hypothetical protein